MKKFTIKGKVVDEKNQPLPELRCVWIARLLDATNEKECSN